MTGPYLQRASGDAPMTSASSHGETELHSPHSSLGSGAVDELSAHTRELLIAALRAHDDGATHDVEKAVREFCDGAHGRRVHAERLLVILKDEWRRLPEARRADPSREGVVLDRMITLCIDEYFEPRLRS